MKLNRKILYGLCRCGKGMNTHTKKISTVLCISFLSSLLNKLYYEKSFIIDSYWNSFLFLFFFTVFSFIISIILLQQKAQWKSYWFLFYFFELFNDTGDGYSKGKKDLLNGNGDIKITAVFCVKPNGVWWCSTNNW